MSNTVIQMESPFPAEPYMNPRQLPYFHTRLMQMREALCAEIRHTLGACRTLAVLRRKSAIGLARLAANPLARYSLDAQERMERLGRLRHTRPGVG